MSQPSSVSSQWFYPLWVSGSPWRKEASLQTLEGGEARIESAASDLPHSASSGPCSEALPFHRLISTNLVIWFPVNSRSLPETSCGAASSKHATMLELHLKAGGRQESSEKTDSTQDKITVLDQGRTLASATSGRTLYCGLI